MPLLGTFSVHVDDGPAPEDPSDRAYFAPPRPREVVQRAYELVDVRPSVTEDASGAVGSASSDKVPSLLSTHGFTVVKHSSALSSWSDYEDASKISGIYYAELTQLVKDVTGCKDIFLITTALRNEDKARMAYHADGVPKGFSDAQVKGTSAGNDSSAAKPVAVRPVRVPHNDCTPLGARQTVRGWREDVRVHCAEAGILPREDSICTGHGFTPCDKASDALIAKEYNNHGRGELGPRYAMYSVWRPIKPVTRDPLAMLPNKDAHNAGSDLVVWPYENRCPGYAGDYKRQFEMLKTKPSVSDEAPAAPATKQLKWYYLSNHQPDEVLIIKLFDSAALGEGATEAMGCYHGSPDLGQNASGEHRESIELRILVVW